MHEGVREEGERSKDQGKMGNRDESIAMWVVDKIPKHLQRHRLCSA